MGLFDAQAVGVPVLQPWRRSVGAADEVSAEGALALLDVFIAVHGPSAPA